MSPRISTYRLILRPLSLTDSRAVFHYRSLPEIIRCQSWAPQDEDEVHRFIEEQSKLHINTPGTWFQFAITLRDSQTLIGDTGLHFPLDDPDQAEVGVTLAPCYQGKGYAAEALIVVLEYLFMDLEKHRVFARVNPRNKPSIRLLERVGIQKEEKKAVILEGSGATVYCMRS